MNRKLIIFFFVSLGLFISGGDVDAFDDQTTHPALTSEVVDFYNSLNPSQPITSEQKDWIILGSEEEDTPPRWLNHFYDPVHQTGWTGLKAGSVSPDAIYKLAVAGNAGYAPVSSIDWLNNNSLQDNLSLYGGNRTWQKGLDNYAAGNTKEAYITLGHALHLLEDMAVPEHTRDDTHAPIVFSGDEGSPFEDYASKWNPGNIKELNIIQNIKSENLTSPAKSSISDYLISLAEYSNKYFFSKDTINDQKYQMPKIISEDEIFGYGFDENGIEIPLVGVHSVWNNTDQKYDIFLEILNRPMYKPILNSYFSHLSKQAVLYGAGVIQLFNKQTNEAVENKEFSTHLVKYDFSFLPIKAVSIIGEGSKILTATQSFFGSIFDGAKKVVNVVVSPFKNTASQSPETFPDQQSVVSNQAVQSSPLQVNLNPSSINPTQEENLVAVETVQLIEPSIQEEISQSDLLAMKNQIDEISDQIDDLTLKVQTYVQSQKSESLGNEERTSINRSADSESDKTASPERTSSIQLFGGGGSIASYITSERRIFPKILITEIQLASASSTHEEFVEIYNPTAESVDLTDWYLQKKTAGGENFTTLVSKNLFTAKNISAHSYLLIAHPSSTFVADIFTNYGIAENNTLALKNPNGEIVDKLGWGSANDCEGTCALSPSDNQSIQRKISNGEFLDTDDNANDFEIQSCPSPKAQSLNCGIGNAANQSATSSQSEATSTLKNILISEIMAAGVDSSDEFIELYNPNNVAVALSDYSIQYVSGGATSTENALKKNFEANNAIPAKGFFLVGRGLDVSRADGYRGSTAADMTERTFSLSAQGATILLARNQSLVSSFADSDIVDGITYSALGANASFERKALLDSNCISAQGQNEFLGNGCDTDSTADFEIRPVSNPQNSQSLPEPRNAPSVSNFKGSFSTSTMDLTFNWDFSPDASGVTSTIVYELRDETVTSTQLFYSSSTNQFIKTLVASSTGQDYIVSLRAYDAEGLGGASSTLAISIPLVSLATSTATSTAAEPQVLIEDATTTWRASTDMCCQLPFWGYKNLSPATTTYTGYTAGGFLITKIHIVNNIDNSGNNHDYFGNLRAAIIDPSSSSILISSSNSCYGENGCNNFDLVFENSPSIPVSFWLQFYVYDGLQGAADWSVNGIRIYGIIPPPL